MDIVRSRLAVADIITYKSKRDNNETAVVTYLRIRHIRRILRILRILHVHRTCTPCLLLPRVTIDDRWIGDGSAREHDHTGRHSISAG